MSPFQVVYGRPPPVLANYINAPSHIPELNDWATSRDQLLNIIKGNLQKAQARMKSQADRHRQDKQFDPATWVYVRLQPYRQT